MTTDSNELLLTLLNEKASSIFSFVRDMEKATLNGDLTISSYESGNGEDVITFTKSDYSDLKNPKTTNITLTLKVDKN